jgi:hypothetical protein
MFVGNWRISHDVSIPADLHARHLPAWVRKSPQTTDGYLLALAKSHGSELVTLDRFIPDAVLIPDEPVAPLTVREELVHSEWAHVMQREAIESSRGIVLR